MPDCSEVCKSRLRAKYFPVQSDQTQSISMLLYDLKVSKKLNVMFETKLDVITNMRKVHDGLSYRFLNSCYLACNVENEKKL